jgi:hypothetical protein
LNEGLAGQRIKRMNARSIKAQIKKAGFNINEWQIEKAYKCYNIILTNYGISDNERQLMTGDQVNIKRETDNNKIQEMAKFFNVTPQRSSVTIYTELAPSTWQ